ncbi:MAG TPA: ABC transporter permease subunit [Candidatus Limnocylindrales bacterium]|nr:ABC transporter permease subunit [Candidatus Limnocylindrales bacterium]
MTDDPMVPEPAELPEIEERSFSPTTPGAVRTQVVNERPLAPRRPRRNPIRAIRSGIAQIIAVGLKELRGRVRGRRAFVVLTFYLLFLGGFAWAWQLVAERAYVQNASLQGGSAAFASSLVGQEVFGALVLVETLLVVFLAPAFTSGAISLEREKQTLDMLAATPISSLAIVVGKLVSALAYVFLLIAASIPLTAIVFVFGGVGPDDVVRAYAVLVVSAIGLGSLGLFISALMQRTQGATVVTFFMVLFLTLGTMFGVLFWNTMAGVSSTSGFATGTGGVGPIKGRAPEAFLWFNPFAAQYDVICGASDGYGGWCSRLNTVTNGAISVGSSGGGVFFPSSNPGFGVDDSGGIAPGGTFGGPIQAVPDRPAIGFGAGGFATDPQPFGVRRDSLWPRSLQAWIVLSIVLILASIQLVSPTRRWRLLRRPARRFA